MQAYSEIHTSTSVVCGVFELISRSFSGQRKKKITMKLNEMDIDRIERHSVHKEGMVYFINTTFSSSHINMVCFCIFI